MYQQKTGILAFSQVGFSSPSLHQVYLFPETRQAEPATLSAFRVRTHYVSEALEYSLPVLLVQRHIWIEAMSYIARRRRNSRDGHTLVPKYGQAMA